MPLPKIRLRTGPPRMPLGALSPSHCFHSTSLPPFLSRFPLLADLPPLLLIVAPLELIFFLRRFHSGAPFTLFNFAAIAATNRGILTQREVNILNIEKGPLPLNNSSSLFPEPTPTFLSRSSSPKHLLSSHL